MTPGRTTIPTRMLQQTAVHWANPVNDGSGGRTFDEPVELAVRWVQKQELFIDASGQEVRSNAVVHVEVEIGLGGYLYLGTLDDLDSDEEGNPLIVSGAYEVRALKTTPATKGDIFVRRVWL